MRLARAKPGDAGRLARILSDWIRETPWMPDRHMPQEDIVFLRRLIGAAEVLVLRNWRGAQGFIARDGETIHALYLRPAVRGRGQGRRLLEAAKARAPRLTLWVLQANSPARAFYAREGFVEVETTDGSSNDEKLPDVRLVWQRGQCNG